MNSASYDLFRHPVRSQSFGHRMGLGASWPKHQEACRELHGMIPSSPPACPGVESAPWLSPKSAFGCTALAAMRRNKHSHSTTGRITGLPRTLTTTAGFAAVILRLQADSTFFPISQHAPWAHRPPLLAVVAVLLLHCILHIFNLAPLLRNFIYGLLVLRTQSCAHSGFMANTTLVLLDAYDRFTDRTLEHC
jgi:hypothetical protein